MTFTLPRWALITLLTAVGGVATVLVGVGAHLGYVAGAYLNEVVAEREAEGVKVPVRRFELIDAILAERFSAQPPAAEQGKE